VLVVALLVIALVVAPPEAEATRGKKRMTTTTITSTAYSDTFPAVNPAILGACPLEVHDRLS